jgi:RHS repeat-associated protein
MLVPGRYSTANDYRYGFQGQEKDNEIKGEGNSLNYTFRMHDPRIGRFFAIDPLFREYVYNSPYAFSENVVINAVELEGLEKSWSYIWKSDIKGGFSGFLKASNWIKIKEEFVAEISGKKHHVYAKPKGVLENVLFQEGQIISGLFVPSNAINVYQGVRNQKDAFGNDFGKGDLGMEVVGIVPGGKFLDKAADTYKVLKNARNVITLGKEGIEFALKSTSRLQHAFKHAQDINQFVGKTWNNATKEAWSKFNTDILENATKSFDNVLGGTKVKGFYKNVDGQDVATYIYAEGKNQGEIATTVVLNPNQMKKFDLN